MRSTVTDTVDLTFKSLSSPLTTSRLGERDRTHTEGMFQIHYYNFILTRSRSLGSPALAFGASKATTSS